MPDNFLFEKSGAVATITFNRPERRNCLDEQIVLEFEGLLHQVRDDTATRVLIVTGTGTSFCAGADVSALKGVTDVAEQRRLFAKRGRRVPRLIGRAFEVLARMDALTIGAINGYAVGGGWSIALAFDFAIAVAGAEFWVPEVDLDVPYRGAPAKMIAARVGPWLAKEIIIGCRHFRAEELLAMGLLNRVVAPAELMPAARELAETLAKKPPGAVAPTKRDINAVFLGPRDF